MLDKHAAILHKSKTQELVLLATGTRRECVMAMLKYRQRFSLKPGEAVFVVMAVGTGFFG